MRKYNIGIFGATGSVGRELIKVLEDRNFLIDSLRLFASEHSAGKSVQTYLGEIEIENANNCDFNELDIAFFAIGGGWPKKHAQKAVDAGCFVIDNSSTFRYDDNVPLVIPEINADSIGDSKLIANPNCTTAIAALPLWALHKEFKLNKVLVSTYQATSGAGNSGMRELEEETMNYLVSKDVGNKTFIHPIPFNTIPHIDKFQENGYTKEEMKVVWETRKIFDDDNINISCTCVRIPTFRAHAESIVVETVNPINPDDVKMLFRNAEGIELKDNIAENIYPMPISASGKYDVETGRIRQNLIFGDKGLEFFVCGDQLLKGAALNAVQIAEYIVRDKLE